MCQDIKYWGGVLWRDSISIKYKPGFYLKRLNGSVGGVA
jgi:hypothetical protein